MSSSLTVFFVACDFVFYAAVFSIVALLEKRSCSPSATCHAHLLTISKLAIVMLALIAVWFTNVQMGVCDRISVFLFVTAGYALPSILKQLKACDQAVEACWTAVFVLLGFLLSLFGGTCVLLAAMGAALSSCAFANAVAIVLVSFVKRKEMN